MKFKFWDSPEAAVPPPLPNKNEHGELILPPEISAALEEGKVAGNFDVQYKTENRTGFQPTETIEEDSETKKKGAGPLKFDLPL